MKQYPSIDRPPSNVPVYAFDKLDGSNIRAEWTRKRGFWKFGTRKRLLGEDDALLGKARTLVLEKYEDDLARIFRAQRWQKAVAFFEYYGPRSFAGNHDPDDEHTVKLFDVAGDKKGLLEPRPFLKLFGDLDHATLLYRGNANQNLIEAVRSGELEGMTFEGVVCKGSYVSPGLPLMFKLKSQAWYDRLKSYCGGDDQMFNNLA